MDIVLHRMRKLQNELLV